MDTEDKPVEELSPAFVRDQLDEILAHEITALLDVDSDSAMMSFNLAGISCITLIIEREREIRQYPDSPPERYTKESFITELVDIGLEKDDALEKTVEMVLGKGYISEDAKGELKAEIPAFMMVGFLDSMFPGMQGMNLVAFILQMNDEVNSGRKSLDLAMQSFTATLKSRGVSVSKDHAQKKASEMVSGKAPAPTQSGEISTKLKKANLNRLSSLIKKRKKRTADAPGHMQIKNIFDKGPSKEELAARKVEIKKIEETAKKTAELAKELALKDEKIREAEEAALQAARQLKEIEQREKQLLEARNQALKTDEKASQLEAREAQMAQKEAQLKALEEKLQQQQKEEQEKQEQEKQERQNKIHEEQLKKDSMADEDIESQIAAFESELTMPCPLCKEGQIESKTTAKGKEFFSCTKPECRFVSWEKPYHFECPLCKNSFLTETTAPNGEKGLKCPRASCSYTQDNLQDPKQNMAARAAATTAPKKKRRLVRRKKRR